MTTIGGTPPFATQNSSDEQRLTSLENAVPGKATPADIAAAINAMIAATLGGDANYAATIAALINAKASQASLNALAASLSGYVTTDALAALGATIPANSFITDAPQTLANLYANYAPTAGNRFKYARVSDLYSESDAPGGVVVNETGTNWQPLRPSRLKSINGNADMTLNSLRTPPQLILTGTLSVTRTITFGTLYTYPGQQYMIRRNAAGTLLGVVLSGLGISLGVNGWSIVEYDGTAWQTLASSGLL